MLGGFLLVLAENVDHLPLQPLQLLVPGMTPTFLVCRFYTPGLADPAQPV
jgi:hypothetical protein